MSADAPRTASQADFTFQLAEMPDVEWKVIGFEGREALSQLFSFQVDLAAQSADVDIEGVLGKNCLLEIDGPSGSRFVHGMVCRFERTGQGRRDTYYSAEVVPVHWLLGKRFHSRIFQEHNCAGMTPQAIIEKVFTDAGMPAGSYRFAISGSYAAREYVVQYRESDLDFISRVMEEEGIFYFFEHTAEGHKMVLADSGVAHVASPLDPECLYREPTGLLGERVSIYALRETADIQSGAFRLKDFDFIKPGTDIGVNKTSDSNTSLEVSDYPGRYTDAREGGRLADVRLQEQQAGKRVLQMSGNVRGLLPGYKFTLQEHPVEALNMEFLVVQVLQRGTQPQGAEDGDGSGGTPRYESDLRVIPATVAFRPPRVTPRPQILGSQTAMVTGPSGEEIYTDQYGRVKVKFHWDLEGAHDENSSRWIRVSQGMAGGQYGMLFLPRVGQEVVVDHLNGDPDRPIITGRVFNNDQMPPYTLPDEKTKSTIKTHTSQGGGGTNEICFEDKAGEEQVLIYAQKDLHIRALNDMVQNVQNDQHLTVDQHRFALIKQNDHCEVTLDRNEKIGGKYSSEVTGDQGNKVGGNASMDVTGKLYLKSAQEVVIEGSMGLTLKVGGNFIKIDPSGVSIVGTLTKINSGGAAGSGQAVTLAAPEAPVDANTATPGQDTTYSATAVEMAALQPPETGFAPTEVPPEEEPVTSWVEIEMVDEEGQPYPNEKYEITFPDGTVRRGRLDRNGQARIGLKEPTEVQVTFPNLDTDAWERIS